MSLNIAQQFMKEMVKGKIFEIFDNFDFSLKVLQPLMATAGGM